MTSSTPKRQTAPVAFRDEALERELAKRADDRLSPSLVAKRDLERYYWLLDTPTDRLVLTNHELALCCDALNGTNFDEPWSIQGVATDVQDAIVYRKLDDKWQVEGEELVRKLIHATTFQLLHLVDRVERYWRSSDGRF